MLGETRPPDFRALQKVVGGSLIWFALAFLLVMVFLIATIRIEGVSGEQVGIKLNKLNGEIEVINKAGKEIYNGITHDFSVVDKTIQTLDMTELVGRGDRKGKDDLKVKTVDGSDVYVDLKVQYRIIPEMADVVVRTSGLGEAYKKLWARDYVRSVCRNSLGELTTESFYDSSLRGAKVLEAKKVINEKLQPFGIEIDSLVIPRKPHFYAEYEEKIKKKKLADQGVLEQQSEALAAKQRQETRIVEETNRKNVAVEQFEGQMKQLVIEAKAQATRAKKAADAYYNKVTIGAEAALYQMTQDAEGILAKKKAEAEGIEALKKALEGEGGRNMVKMEY
ncbi:MAG TPA: hypothetical protein HPP83_11135, partial [Candidatus Hydrogenedentes bacterium]|nr:hypothetical protein [Candidatus Hydrogenedentota bacterium]